MKALSLWQPWASLWCSDCKVHETRHWYTTHRGWLLVHAAKKFVRDFEQGEPLRLILDSEFGGHWAMDLPSGAIIGAVNMVDCKRTEDTIAAWKGGDHGPIPILNWHDYQCGDFADGRFAWERREFKRFARPIPYRGMQSIFEVPDDVVREAMAA